MTDMTPRGAVLTDCSSLALLELPSGSTGEWSVSGSLPWEGGQSEDELCCGAGVDAKEKNIIMKMKEKYSQNTVKGLIDGFCANLLCQYSGIVAGSMDVLIGKQ